MVNPLACRACAIRFFSSKLTFSSARTQWNPSEIAARERDLLLVCLLMGGAGGSVQLLRTFEVFSVLVQLPGILPAPTLFVAAAANCVSKETQTVRAGVPEGPGGWL